MFLNRILSQQGHFPREGYIFLLLLYSIQWLYVYYVILSHSLLEYTNVSFASLFTNKNWETPSGIAL